ncbi:hypothetical protein [Hwangdonia seohaensis]|uniref:Uncharacterized protein n=1 Tax=Hwangdonia seohaensis TaxID=1240727 RepID=A0ABW3R9W8_9FLAO|nr:hypothetical protein [Hwangdonia seohaensis]
MRLKSLTDKKLATYNLPSSSELKQDIELANNDLIKYGKAFLEGDLTDYDTAIKIKNKHKEPYKIVKSRKDFLKSNNIFSKDF